MVESYRDYSSILPDPWSTASEQSQAEETSVIVSD